MQKMIVLDVALKMPDGGLFTSSYELISQSVQEAKQTFLKRCKLLGYEEKRIIFCGWRVA